MYEVVIHDGAHYRDPELERYKTVGSIDQIKEGARVKNRQKYKSRRLWIELLNEDGVTCEDWLFFYGGEEA